MFRYLPAVLGVVAASNLAACADEENVRVRRPRTEYVVAAAPQEVVIAQPRVAEVVVAQPRTEVVTVAAAPRQVVVAEPRMEEVIVNEGPPVEHLRAAPNVMYEGRRVYWYGSRWYYQNGNRWSYYRNEPGALRVRRY